MISGTQGMSSVALAQIQRQQAERNADLAEQRARTLQAETRQARNEADRADERARSLEIDTDRAENEATRARRGLASTPLQPRDVQFGGLREPTLPPDIASASPAPARAPVVNALGELIGKVINVTA